MKRTAIRKPITHVVQLFEPGVSGPILTAILDPRTGVLSKSRSTDPEMWQNLSQYRGYDLRAKAIDGIETFAGRLGINPQPVLMGLTQV